MGFRRRQGWATKNRVGFVLKGGLGLVRLGLGRQESGRVSPDRVQVSPGWGSQTRLGQVRVRVRFESGIGFGFGLDCSCI